MEKLTEYFPETPTDERLQRCFHLLCDLTHASFSVDCVLRKGSEIGSISVLDRGLHEMLLGSAFEYPVNYAQAGKFFSRERFCTADSFLGFTVIVCSILRPDGAWLCSVGPFRADPGGENTFIRLLREAGVPTTQLSNAIQVYRSIPVVEPVRITQAVRRILSEYFPEFREMETEPRSFAADGHEIHVEQSLVNKRLEEASEDLLLLFRNYAAALQQGDTERARITIHDSFDHSHADNRTGLSRAKNDLLGLNAISCAVLSSVNIPALTVFQLYRQMESKIDALTDVSRIPYLAYELCHSYCVAVKNAGREKYSAAVLDVINYVDFHLSDRLSLDLIARHFERNPSTLSSLFHKETGSTLTDYIRCRRVEKAKLLLISSDASVSEIAGMVGYEDFAYFSRVFRQVTGSSPSQYRDRRLSGKL